jgi:pimeloyl-ACP methyl ester carboxylesterase
MMPRRFITVAGVRTAFLDDGAGDPIVALHGVPTSSELFEPLLPWLAGRRVIAPDLLGQGETATLSGSLGYARYFAHLDAFLDAVAPPRFDLVVHDLGGVLGLDWASRHPDRVRRLVVLSTSVTASVRWVALWAVIYGLELIGGSGAVAASIVRLARRPGAVPVELAARWAQPWTRRRVARGLDLANPARLGPIADRLSAVRAPTLIVWGTRDNVFPASEAQRLRRLLPGASLRLVPGAGHWSMLDAADLVGHHIKDFLGAPAIQAGVGHPGFAGGDRDAD